MLVVLHSNVLALELCAIDIPNFIEKWLSDVWQNQLLPLS